MSRLLQSCIKLGGDTDTVASIALGAAACCQEIEPDLPPALVAGLENGPFGRDYLENLDRGLLSLVKR
jgi:ADP-ribosylglycohydrolase